jgi:hypothetical protein
VHKALSSSNPKKKEYWRSQWKGKEEGDGDEDDQKPMFENSIMKHTKKFLKNGGGEKNRGGQRK